LTVLLRCKYIANKNTKTSFCGKQQRDATAYRLGL
jgi:hypothetical protein